MINPWPYASTSDVELILAPLSRSERPVFVAMLARLVEFNNSRSRARTHRTPITKSKD
jgi:hypothetical protein